jgi:hypothetical protein
MTAPLSQRTPQQALAALLEQQSPASLLFAGHSEMPAISAFCQSRADTRLYHAASAPLSAELSSQRYDLAVVADCLEHLPKRTGIEMLGSIRNLNASRIAVLVDLDACQWTEQDFFALAMHAAEAFSRENQRLTLFTYDLHDYKQVPDWLNARFWANPENFGKYWW